MDSRLSETLHGKFTCLLNQNYSVKLWLNQCGTSRLGGAYLGQIIGQACKMHDTKKKLRLLELSPNYFCKRARDKMEALL